MLNLSLIQAAHGMRAMQARIDTIAHNIANLNTVGYKGKEVTFGEIFYQEMENQPGGEVGGAQGRLTPEMIRLTSGILVSGTPTRFTQGQRIDTGVETDLMIEGRGFFRVARNVDDAGNLDPEAIRYTRSGAFQLSPINGRRYLVTASGEFVLDENDLPISFEEGERFRVESDGTITVIRADGSISPYPGGRIAVNDFDNPQLLSNAGNNLWIYAGDGNPNAPAPQLLNGNSEAFRLVQGALEASNVQMQEEMPALIAAQRTLSMLARSFQFSDQMLGMANELVRK